MSEKRPTLSAYADGNDSWNGTFDGTVRSAIERIKDVLLYSAAYLAVIAAVETATVMAALSLPPNPAPLVVGLVAFAVYAGDRIPDVDPGTAIGAPTSDVVPEYDRLPEEGDLPGSAHRERDEQPPVRRDGDAGRERPWHGHRPRRPVPRHQ